ncbi:MAG: fatty acid desaturase [Deltaproteobacteria bacterium]|jgi:omega-6 fatty acid desaturase (delta-12 desaturase)|nr:fatty acid desaturase [Deltaproteobacteria bacterium]
MDSALPTSIPSDIIVDKPAPREGKVLIDASRPFAVESPARTIWVVASTLAAWATCFALATALPAPWYARLPFTVLTALLATRSFILFHDVMHGAMCRGNALWAKVCRAFVTAYGFWILTPPRIWKESHNYHHAHTAKLVGSHIGSYMMLTPAMYAKATPSQQRMYRLMRSPLNVAVGYVTVFLWGMCVGPFLKNKKKHLDSAVALVLHFAQIALTVHFFGAGAALTGVIGSVAIACALGAYLFYAQHNFPDIHVQPRETWSYTRAATESSSFMEMSPVMHWFTGNIGFHHVHHLNPQIPFYQLPSAMAGIPELQHPGRTSLRLKDIRAAFALKLWDPSKGRMVGYDEVGDQHAPMAESPIHRENALP